MNKPREDGRKDLHPHREEETKKVEKEVNCCSLTEEMHGRNFWKSEHDAGQILPDQGGGGSKVCRGVKASKLAFTLHAVLAKCRFKALRSPVRSLQNKGSGGDVRLKDWSWHSASYSHQCWLAGWDYKAAHPPGPNGFS